jgi:hypothetical protein
MDDAGKMTSEEMEELKGLAASMGLYDDKNPCKRAVILGKAIKALEQQPCEDSISRQAVMDAIEDDNRNGHYSCFASNNDAQCFKDVIRSLPSVTQKSGKWIVHEKPYGIRYLECPYCNIWYLNEHLIRNSYCPNCGAKMVEPQERSEE